MTQVCRTSAEREGAYRFVENDAVRASEITAAARRAAVRRISKNEPYVLVPVDKSSLTLSDPQCTRELSRVSRHTRGVHVTTALILSARGTAYGMGAQHYWLRPKAHTKKERYKKPVADKETGRFLDCIRDVREALAGEGAPEPWFQIDRGGDMKEHFELGQELGVRITFRAAWNRRLTGDEPEYLRDRLRKHNAQGLMHVDIKRTRRRRLLRVPLALRWLPITVRLKDRRTKALSEATLWCVQAREVGTPPKGCKRIEWTLWTNVPCQTQADAERVVASYALRWRIEDFHRTWKTTCRVEKNWLHSYAAIVRWASILACVSTRIDRLRYLIRTSPDLPASVEFSDAELRTLYRLRFKKPPPADWSISINQAVRWVADFGGYSGPAYPRGKPGSVTIGRGLDYLAPAAALYQQMAE